jgi:hypothetical protein
MISSKPTYPQLSIWSTEHDKISQHQQTFDNSIQNKNGSNNIHCFDSITDGNTTEYKKQRYPQ